MAGACPGEYGPLPADPPRLRAVRSLQVTPIYCIATVATYNSAGRVNIAFVITFQFRTASAASRKGSARERFE
jgi:hypothetical protein